MNRNVESYQCLLLEPDEDQKKEREREWKYHLSFKPIILGGEAFDFCLALTAFSAVNRF